MNNDNSTNTEAAVSSAAQENGTPAFDKTYPHLYVETAAYMDKPVEERVARAHSDKFVLHENARLVLSAMKDVYLRPAGAVRPACLAVIGNSNEGKTATARRFFRDLGGEPAHIFGCYDEMPVLLVEMPPRATEPRLCLAIARALGLTGYSSSKARLVTDNVYRALVAKKVRVLVLIEFQHVFPLPRSERRVVLDLVKGISNHGISVITIGTKQAQDCLSEDEQVANRMRIVRLNGFRDDQKFKDFLHSLEPYYPLPKKSNMASKEFAAEVYKRTNGVTGEVVMLCNAAAVWAIRAKRDSIDLAALRSALVYPAANAA